MRMRALLAMSVALIATACSGPMIVNDADDNASDFFRHAAAGRDLRAVIVGNPFNVAKTVTDAAVVDSMQGRFTGAPTHLTTAPGDNNHRPQARVVVVLDADAGMSGRKVCKSSDPAHEVAGTRSGERLRVLAAFCESGLSYAEARGSIPRPADPGDPAFRALLGSMAYMLIPSERPKSDDNSPVLILSMH